MIEQNAGDCKGLQTIARAVAIGAVAIVAGLIFLAGYGLFELGRMT